MKVINKDELKKINGGFDINGTIMNAFIKGINEIINAGRVLGTAIRRLFDNSMCELK